MFFIPIKPKLRKTVIVGILGTNSNVSESGINQLIHQVTEGDTQIFNRRLCCVEIHLKL